MGSIHFVKNNVRQKYFNQFSKKNLIPNKSNISQNITHLFNKQFVLIPTTSPVSISSAIIDKF